MQLVNRLHFRNLRGDIFGGLTAAIVALPLALAFGVSSGAGAINGLYGAIFVGFFAALCGGTPSQISGPTGPMTVVMATVFTALTDKNSDTGLAIVFTVVMLGGLFQILFGILRLGKYITLMPYTVISGFMSGVGVIIIIIEIAPLLGHDASGSVVESLSKLPSFLMTPNPAATALGLLTLAIVFGSPPKLNRILPAPLLALIVCTAISVYLLPGNEIARIGEIPIGLPKLHLPVFDFAQLKDIVGYGLMLATLGSIDSLLTSLVADNITRTQHDSDRELIGQGIGNLISGLFGGLPGAGATMRTVINVYAGGKTALSGIVHALVLLSIVLWAGGLTESIPHTVLAGILIKVGIDIIDWSFITRAHRISLKATGLMYAVLLLTVFVDLITAVAVGVFVANLLTVKRLSEIQSDKMKVITTPSDETSLSHEEKLLLKQANGRILLFRLGGPMSFGAAKTISQRMSIVENYDVLILDFGDVPMLGVTTSLAIENMVKDACEKRRQVFLVGASGKVKARLRRLKVLNLLPPKNRVANRLYALKMAMALIQGQFGEDNSTQFKGNGSDTDDWDTNDTQAQTNETVIKDR
ncbi:MAG: SulP family inorganic anion transporter [Symploca sp. SIO3C6]|uniref:SulP family inorganic anion transporter n=1 Tax=Symploca sp. SIO1C4 TaxID=2607765 RepID=A0A6B3NAX4_9CYAN|nr:SulP family inorganic anion transporter [Symploca sp. SIO3C6]NER27732.1 SulP family inorganic anion transporter [Symploca sp. SIO1C4]NET03512.1 SulP family inorganic anion transporter [Symploca sp. SIO2B6]